MKIEKSRYEGYIWFSDQKEPKVFNNEEFELEIADDKNPFIIEGQLFDSTNNKSVSIKYVDGEYIVKPYDVQENERDNAQEYLSNRMDDRKLLFVQRWEEQPDDLCEGMQVLQPAELVFVGFNNKEE